MYVSVKQDETLMYNVWISKQDEMIMYYVYISVNKICICCV